MKRFCCLVLTIILVMTNNIFVDKSIKSYADIDTIVATPEAFLTALEEGKTNIVVSGIITIDNGADADGKMYPVYIPGGTTISGEEGASICCRCPIQLTGNDVLIKDIEMVFSSTDALNSVPHREIFLAGYSLTFDNVKTYLDGLGGSLGGLGGTEEELLPTVYAGGFEGTSVGANASLTIQNANSYTMFKAIYMGNDTGTDGKVEYTGKAILNVCNGVTIRDGIYTQYNSEAVINISGSGNLYDTIIQGNDNTTVNIDTTSVYRARINNVDNINITNSAYLQLNSGSVTNVDIKSGACLDLLENISISISGNFVGGIKDETNDIDTRGVLVLDIDNDLTIGGEISGATFLHTSNRNFPGEFTSDKIYVKGVKKTEDEIGFELADSKKEYYELVYNNDGFKAVAINQDNEYPVVSKIEVTEYEENVDINNIKGSDYIPNQNAPYIKVNWYDADNNLISNEMVNEMWLFAYDMIIGVKKEYWDNDNSLTETDWGNVVEFTTKEGEEGKYYFYAGSSNDIKTGDYVFIFLSEFYDGTLTTVADVKALENIKASISVNLYDSTEQPTEPEEPTTSEKPTEPEEPTTSEQPTKPAIYSVKSVKLSKTSYIYNGKYRRPQVIAKDSKGDIIDSSNYNVSYKNNRNVGYGIVIITFKNNYKGTVVRRFTIKPKGTSIIKLTPKKRQMTVRWKKQKKQISGYIIQYSTSNKFDKKYTKNLVVNKKSTTRTIKKLKSGKRYYVRIRVYNTVKLNNKNKKLYSSWSKIKPVKIK